MFENWLFFKAKSFRAWALFWLTFYAFCLSYYSTGRSWRKRWGDTVNREMFSFGFRCKWKWTRLGCRNPARLSKSPRLLHCTSRSFSLPICPTSLSARRTHFPHLSSENADKKKKIRYIHMPYRLLQYPRLIWRKSGPTFSLCVPWKREKKIKTFEFP